MKVKFYCKKETLFGIFEAILCIASDVYFLKTVCHGRMLSYANTCTLQF